MADMLRLQIAFGRATAHPFEPAALALAKARAKLMRNVHHDMGMDAHPFRVFQRPEVGKLRAVGAAKVGCQLQEQPGRAM